MKPMKVTRNFKTMAINLQLVAASKDLKGNRNRFVLFNANEQFDNGCSSITSWWVGTNKSLTNRQINNEECSTFPSIVLGEQGSAKA